MKVVLRKRKLKSGDHSLYLDYYVHGEREREFLELYIIPGKSEDNKETMLLAERIRALRDHEIKSGNFGMIATHKKKLNFFTYAQTFIDNYKKADINLFKAVRMQFGYFLGTKALPRLDIPCSAIGERMMEDFKEYLHQNLNGESPFNYFKSMKRIMKFATKDGYFKSNPADDIPNKNHRENELTKEVLTDEEINLLAHTLCGNNEVKRAFLFSTQTGLRKCDIVRLQWKHVVELKYIDFGQVKVDNRKNIVPLNSNALQFIGTPGEPNEYVFHLKTGAAVNKVLKNWMKTAGIKKHITYHCARHSLGTNLYAHTSDLKTTSKTLGHTTTRHTEKYTHISDVMKQNAVNKLPLIKF